MNTYDKDTLKAIREQVKIIAIAKYFENAPDEEEEENVVICPRCHEHTYYSMKLITGMKWDKMCLSDKCIDAAILGMYDLTY